MIPTLQAGVLVPEYRRMDPDARAYVRAVEAADGNALELGVQLAINRFVLGCKADGIWNAIKASCILAGARTLNGALVPLVGAAPTNFNFVSGDYNRKTGLVGDGSTKHLNSNRNNNADPQSNKHISVYVSSACTVATGFPRYIGSHRSTPPYDGTQIGRDSASTSTFAAVDSPTISRDGQVGFHGASRSNASTFTYRSRGGESVASQDQQAVVAEIHPVFAGRSGGNIVSLTNARLAFYSFGESLNLALLDARVTTLMNTFAAVIR